MVRLRFSALLLAVALVACDTGEAQLDFEAEAALPPSGITPTDEEGNPTGPPDPNDWRAAPAFPSVRVGPAFPNPVPAGFGGSVRVPVTVPFAGVVRGEVVLLLFDPREFLQPIAQVDAVPASVFPGTTELRFTRSDVQAAFRSADPRGLYRAYVRDGSGRLLSYGDILVE